MLAQILDCVYPARCALCGEFDPRPICPTCRTEIAPLSQDPGKGSGALDLTVSAHPYTDRAAQAIRRLKYERVLVHAPEMSAELADLALRSGFASADVVVPVPIHWSRECERGFNQAVVLSSHFQRVEPKLLTRIRRTRQQVGLTPERRAVNLRGAFRAESAVAGLEVLLLDDVITSGGTARECAAALKAAGAARVNLVTYCAGGSVFDA